MTQIYKVYLNNMDGQVIALDNGTVIQAFIGPKPTDPPDAVVIVPVGGVGAGGADGSTPVVHVTRTRVDAPWADLIADLGDRLDGWNDDTDGSGGAAGSKQD